ncbi:MAG: hypothetical protein ACRDT0_18895 [Pseudonocardiaceae bacterium]
MIRNLTLHAVHLVTAGGQVQLPPEAPPARLRQQATPAGRVEVAGTAIELFDIGAGGVEGLPVPRPGVWLVVPRLIAEACPERRDLVFPYREVRDGAGRVVGCRALGRAAGAGV